MHASQRARGVGMGFPLFMSLRDGMTRDVPVLDRGARVFPRSSTVRFSRRGRTAICAHILGRGVPEGSLAPLAIVLPPTLRVFRYRHVGTGCLPYAIWGASRESGFGCVYKKSVRANPMSNRPVDTPGEKP